MAHTIMRDCRNPTCTKGEFPSATARAAYCSSACRLIHHRATEKTATPTTKPKEETPMSTSQLFQPDAAHLKALQDAAIQCYRDYTHCDIEGSERLGMIESFELKTFQEALDKYVSLLAQGYRKSDKGEHLPFITSMPSVAYDFVTLHLQKPEAQVEADIAEIREEVEARYLEKLAQDKAVAVAREVESKLRGARDKKLQAERDAKAAAEAAEYAAIEAEVLAALGGGAQ
jgi:hypothetical protein